jgi:phosphate:Na+ symporter
MINGLFLFISGLALFLFGMLKLSAFMQQLFGGRMREYIRFSVKKPVYGLIMGIVTTILFQSSSATTLLTIGIVSAGLISFFHSLGIILGADIGTTLTVQLVVWKFTSISPLILFTGATLLFSTKEKWKQAGEALVYFGLIFFGLQLTADATLPLKENKYFLDMFQQTKNPFIGIGIGILFTAIVQSSAIPISIAAIMGQQGLIAIENAIPIMLGANIGTTVTALMGSIAANINGKRSAFAHFLFKLIGAAICLAALPFFLLVLEHMSSNIAQQIALGHFLFNVILAVFCIPFLTPLSKLIEKIIPGKDNLLPLWPEYLDSKCLAKPEDALICVRKELSRGIAFASRMFTESSGLITKFSETKKKDVNYIELVIDNLQTEIINYLWNISCGHLSPSLSKKLFAFSKIVYEIERIGDRSTNLVELSEEKYKRKSLFSGAAQEELEEIRTLIIYNIDDAASLIEIKDTMKISMIFERNRRVKIRIKRATEDHLERFYQKICLAEAGPIFVDMLVNLERISDHCQAVAECIHGIDEET